jgi:hypothetical protein
MVVGSNEYADYVDMLSVNPFMLRRFHTYYTEYMKNNNVVPFAEIKCGFEALWLVDIVKNPTIYREYRVYIREHCIKQGKPWAAVYVDFWEKCQNKMEARLVRNFSVFDTIGQYKVDEFYKWLDDSKPPPPKQNSSKSTVVPFVVYETDVKVLEKNAYRLYRQNEMWKHVKKGEITDNDDWYKQLKATIVKLIRIQLSFIDEIHGKTAKRNYYVYEINRVILRFHKCFHTPGFTFGCENQTFLKTCIQKGLEFATKHGIPEGTYLLAKIRPEMMSENCCPCINVYSDDYRNTDVDKLLEIRVFWNVSWCHTYWSEEYHMCVLSPPESS